MPVLPSTIDPAVAVTCFRSQRGLLLNLIRHCLPTLGNSLFAEYIIPQDVYERACNQNLGSNERGGALLDCVEARIEAMASDFTKFVHILESEPFLELLVDGLVRSYCTLSGAPTANHQPAISSAVSHYRMYLKSVYKNSPISPENKWPPTPSREYINLAVVEGKSCREKCIGHTLKGNVKQALEDNREISMEEILEVDEGQAKLRLVLIEGAPGIGKSTLAWELCRRWEEFSCMKKYNLVVLLRLREEEVQKITDISELFCSYSSTKEKKTLVEEVLMNQGHGILFILDGFDELPKKLQQYGFLLKLIRGNVLPESTVLVTSRPSATAELLTSCRPQVQKRVEILGFTQESVEAYASSVFKSEPDELDNFKAYISSSGNPAINSLMYIPLNAAIVIEIYRNSKSDSFLPYTLTELYIQLCLTILNRHLKSNHASVMATNLNNLPFDLHKQFLELARVAFEGFKEREIIFYTIPPNFLHFGFLDSVSALYGGGGVSYNFLHLTLQEFFAAYYISQLSDGGLEVFKEHGENWKWNIVWRFVAGLTKFKGYQDHISTNSWFWLDWIESSTVWVSTRFIQCLYEAQTIKYFFLALKAQPHMIGFAFDGTQATLDTYAFGYCISNVPCDAFWSVYIGEDPYCWDVHGAVRSFTCGLKTNAPSIGTIINISFQRGTAFDIGDFKSCPLHGVTELLIPECSFVTFNLSELIPHMTCLNELDISGSHAPYSTELNNHRDGLIEILQQLCHSNVTKLNISGCGLRNLLEHSPRECSSALKQLMSPISGKLEELKVIDQIMEDFDDGTLVSILFAPSSLKTLYLSCRNKLISASPRERNPHSPRLNLHAIVFNTTEPNYSALEYLIHPLSGTLEELVVNIYNPVEEVDDGILVSLVLGPSSIKALSLSYKCKDYKPISLSSLKNNTSLTKLDLDVGNLRGSCDAIAKLLKYNKSLQYVKLSRFLAEDTDTMRIILSALHDNDTLLSIELWISDLCECRYADFEIFNDESEKFVTVADYMALHDVPFFDARITWKDWDRFNLTSEGKKK